MNDWINSIHSTMGSFSHEKNGSVLAFAALTLPLIACVSLFAIDHVAVSNQKASLQRAVDAAAIAAARELHFIKSDARGADEATLGEIARSYAEQNLNATGLVATVKIEEQTLVDVRVEMSISSPFNKVFAGERTISANAKAQIFSGQNICIISAETGSLYPGLQLLGQSEIKAGECGIYSNSRERHSIVVASDAHVDASFICSGGGYKGHDSSFSNGVNTDCPQIVNPLDSRPYPDVPACDTSAPGVIHSNQSVNLSPGTYCGGLTIQENADVWFMPGEYVFKDGPLIVQDQAQVAGDNVGLFFDDADSYFEFRDDAEITFTAPETGAMAGIVVSARKMCANTNCTSPRHFLISSARVRSLLGTINLSQDDLTIDTTMPVSEEAAFTILIIDNLTMKQSPSLILNTDYSATTVPVPSGFAGPPSTRIVE